LQVRRRALRGRPRGGRQVEREVAHHLAAAPPVPALRTRELVLDLGREVESTWQLTFDRKRRSGRGDGRSGGGSRVGRGRSQRGARIYYIRYIFYSGRPGHCERLSAFQGAREHETQFPRLFVWPLLK
jgi:hypothetical protein